MITYCNVGVPRVGHQTDPSCTLNPHSSSEFQNRSEDSPNSFKLEIVVTSLVSRRKRLPAACVAECFENPGTLAENVVQQVLGSFVGSSDRNSANLKMED